MRLANKTALITGGNSGIGLATAKLFVAEGAGSSSPGAIRRRSRRLRRNWGRTRSRSSPTPPTSPRPKPRSSKAVEKFGKLDIVFANAGIAGGTPLGATTLEAFEKVIRTNITCVFFTVQAAVPHLNDGASIILNGSVISVLGNPGYSAYAREQGRRAGDGAGDGVGTVAARHPRQRGVARRDPHADLGRGARDARSREGIRKAHRRNHAARPHRRTRHMSKTVLFLASDDAAHVQGQELFVDGGATASPSGAPIYRG